MEYPANFAFYISSIALNKEVTSKINNNNNTRVSWKSSETVGNYTMNFMSLVTL